MSEFETPQNDSTERHAGLDLGHLVEQIYEECLAEEKEPIVPIERIVSQAWFGHQARISLEEAVAAFERVGGYEIERHESHGVAIYTVYSACFAASL